MAKPYWNFLFTITTSRTFVLRLPVERDVVEHVMGDVAGNVVGYIEKDVVKEPISTSI